MKSSPLNLSKLGLNLHLPHLKLEPRHYPARFFCGIQLTAHFIPVLLQDTPIHVAPILAGNISSLKGLSSIGTGCPGKWLSHHPWRYLKVSRCGA